MWKGRERKVEQMEKLGHDAVSKTPLPTSWGVLKLDWLSTVVPR